MEEKAEAFGGAVVGGVGFELGGVGVAELGVRCVKEKGDLLGAGCERGTLAAGTRRGLGAGERRACALLKSERVCFLGPTVSACAH